MDNVNKISLELLFFALIGLICLGAMLYLDGPQHSISTYYKYDISSYFFKIWLLTLIIGAYRNKKLKYTIIPIIGLIIFDANPEYVIINHLHNISAVLFFGVITVSFLIYKRSRIFGILMLLSYSIYFYNIFIGEMITILIIYLYFINNIIRLNSKNYKNN